MEFSSSSEDDEEIVLTDLHKILLQVFISRKIISTSNAKELLIDLQRDFRVPVSADEIDNVIDQINSNLAKIHLEIKKMASEKDGKFYWGLINSNNDEVSKVATHYSIPDIDYFKALLEYLINHDGEMTIVDAVNLSRESKEKNLTMAKAEHLLGQFCSESWLTYNESHTRINVGVRTFLELIPYIKDTYGDDVPECPICNELVILGTMYKNQKIHLHCERKINNNNNND